MSNQVIEIRSLNTNEAGETIPPSSPQGAGSTSSGKLFQPAHKTSTPGSMPWKKAKLGACASLFAIALVAIIIGSILPKMANDTIHTGVLKQVQLDPDRMDADKLAKWLNSTTPMDFHIFTITNLKNALLTGEKLNFQEIGPVKCNRYSYKYNVSWDIPNSRVSYKTLTTFDVLPESWPLLSQTAVGPNLFWFGAGAQTMQGYLQGIQELQGGTNALTADFNYLQENLLTGLFLGQLLPSTLNSFNTKTSVLLTEFHGLGIAYYLNFAKSFCTQVEAQAPVFFPNGPGSCWNNTINGWATAKSYLSGNTTANPTALNPALGSSIYFAGFELDTPLITANVGTSGVGAWLFDPTNPYGVASITGLSHWSALGSSALSAAAKQQALLAIMQANSLTDPNDLAIIGAWIQKLQGADADTTVIGAAYQKSVTSAVGGALQQFTGYNPASPFNAAFSNISAYIPTSWLDIGALQFGSGGVVGVGITTATNVSFAIYGRGASVSDLGLQPYIGPTSPFNFNDLASPSTLGQAEPMEFTAGIAYAIAHSSAYSPPLTRLYITMDPSLLYVNAATNTLINLDIAHAKALLAILTDATNPSGYITLTSGLSAIVQQYAKAFQTCIATPATPCYGNVTIAQATAKATVNGFINAYIPAYLASTTCAADANNKAALQLVLAAKVDVHNFYAIYTYLYTYLGSELAGSLGQIDADGIAPQNMGMFTKTSVFDILFGYNARFPGQFIPGIAGTYHWSKGNGPTFLQDLLNADYVTKLGRDTVVDTGHANPDTAGSFIAYEGVYKYKSNCEMKDPGSQYACATAAGKTLNDYNILNSYEVLQGNGDGDRSAPFKESDADIVPTLGLYVKEAYRSLPLKYDGPTTIKGIDLRRYVVDDAVLTMGPLGDANPYKNNVKYNQGATNITSPDGFYSIQRPLGGIPVLLSHPYFNNSSPSFDAGITCTAPLTGVIGPCQAAYDYNTHQTHLDFEPLTGLAFNGAKRLMASLRVSAIEYFAGVAACPLNATCAPNSCSLTSAAANSYSQYFGTPFQSVVPGGFTFHYENLFPVGRPDTLILPYYWGDLHDTINDADTADFLSKKSDIDNARKVTHALFYAGIVLGSVGVVASIASIVLILKS